MYFPYNNRLVNLPGEHRYTELLAEVPRSLEQYSYDLDLFNL